MGKKLNELQIEHKFAFWMRSLDLALQNSVVSPVVLPGERCPKTWDCSRNGGAAKEFMSDRVREFSGDIKEHLRHFRKFYEILDTIDTVLRASDYSHLGKNFGKLYLSLRSYGDLVEGNKFGPDPFLQYLYTNGQESQDQYESSSYELKLIPKLRFNPQNNREGFDVDSVSLYETAENITAFLQMDSLGVGSMDSVGSIFAEGSIDNFKNHLSNTRLLLKRVGYKE